MDRPARTFGSELRRWRLQRGLTQMGLAHAAEVSTRHLSWLESGRAEPSRAMVLRLAERLDVPLRERNALLVAAGFAPMYGQHRLDDAPLAALRESLQRLLEAHDPWPAMAVDRHWNLVAANAAVPRLLGWLGLPLAEGGPVNVVRLSLDRRGLGQWLVDGERWREHVSRRLRRQWAATGDEAFAALLAEVSAPSHEGHAAAAVEPVPPPPALTPVLPLVLDTPKGRLSFLTTVTVFGAPHDVLASEIAVETLLPADAPTAERLRSLALDAPG
ncbi:MAG: helix-turn-helix domain-containing protein [Rubrivivax sp.]|jgi:transcriptional regulator with XRE-family HTH domain